MWHWMTRKKNEQLCFYCKKKNHRVLTNDSWETVFLSVFSLNYSFQLHNYPFPYKQYLCYTSKHLWAICVNRCVIFFAVWLQLSEHSRIFKITLAELQPTNLAVKVYVRPKQPHPVAPLQCDTSLWLRWQIWLRGPSASSLFILPSSLLVVCCTSVVI